MLSKIEMKYYKDITRIADALEKIAKLYEEEQVRRTFPAPWPGQPSGEEHGNDEYKKIGERILQRLHKKGMAQFELANACGITEVTLSRYVSGSRVAKGPLYAQMARVLGCSVEWLLRGEENE